MKMELAASEYEQYEPRYSMVEAGDSVLPGLKLTRRLISSAVTRKVAKEYQAAAEVVLIEKKTKKKGTR